MIYLNGITSKQDINRKHLNANLLNRVVIRLDYLRIVSIKELVSGIQEYLAPYGILLTNDEFINNIEFQINDPEISSLDNFSVKKSINKEQIYNFEAEDESCQISIGESFIVFNIACSKHYCLEDYIKLFCNIAISVQNKFNYIKFTRIGIRKINNIICKDIYLYNCFEKDFFSGLSLGNEGSLEISYMRRYSLDNFSYNAHSFNLSKLIQEGIIEGDGDSKAYNVILDIDGYIKDTIPNKFKDYDDIRNTIISINDDIFDIFKASITYELALDLIKGESSKIEWGINKNA